MRPYHLGADNKPCLWPIPDECIWNSERYKIGSILKVLVCDEFRKEALMFIEQLEKIYPVRAVVVHEDADISIDKTNEERINPEGYFLKVCDNGVVLKACSRKGAFYGLQTLLQLIANSPDPSIHGVVINDSPSEPLRSVHVHLKEKDVPLFEGFIDFLARYKINQLIVNSDIPKFFALEEEISELNEYTKNRFVDVIFDNMPCCSVQTICTNTRKVERSEGITDVLYGALKTSCILWWKGYKPVKTLVGDVMPEFLEKVAAQMYPLERDRIAGMEYPSRNSREYKTLNIREFYNSPLYRLSWRIDDYDYTFMIDSKNLPNTVPFSILQGVTDIRLQAAFILAGNGFNTGVSGIPANMCLRSLVFLHSYIADKKDLNEKAVGYYLIHYRDGRCIRVEIIYGRTISCVKAGYGSNTAAYDANPVFTGITRFNMPYVIYSQEWVNPRPDKEVQKIDVVPVEGLDDGGIAVFGITAII